MENLFQFTPPYVFYYRVPHHEQIKEKYLPKIIEVYKQNKNNPQYNWSNSSLSGMKTSYGLDNSIFFDKNFCDNIIRPALSSLFETHPEYKQKSISSKIKSMWWNVYKSGDYADFHSHGLVCDISGVYIMQSTEPNPTVFVMSDGFYENQLHRTDYAAEGGVLLFPSSLRHYCPVIQNDRVTVSFNVTIRY